MANQTIALDAVSARVLVQELEHLEEIKKTLLRIIPEPFLIKGSGFWWEKNDLEAAGDIEKGRYTKIKSHQHLDRFLEKLEWPLTLPARPRGNSPNSQNILRKKPENSFTFF